MMARRLRAGTSDVGVPTSNGVPSALSHTLVVTQSQSNMSRVNDDNLTICDVCAIPDLASTVTVT